MSIPDLYLEGNSIKYKNWQSNYFEANTCRDCREKHGKIYDTNVKSHQPEHIFCRCAIVPMRTKEVGTSTDEGFNGADAWLIYRNKLPDCYITKAEAFILGWSRKKGNLSDVLPGYLLGGDVFDNNKHKLPESGKRVWYEADINYIAGFRNSDRILYSNDGLLFASYDHYETFYEITK